MAAKINPPTFSKSNSYELYKQELLAWKEITDLDKRKQGVAIALTLPEDDEMQIREKVFEFNRPQRRRWANQTFRILR